MAKFDDREDECTWDEDGDCDDPYCDHRRDFEVSISRTIEFRVNAHNEEEAINIVNNLDILSVNEPTDDLIDGFSDDNDDVLIQDAAEADAERRRHAAEVQRILQEEAATP